MKILQEGDSGAKWGTGENGAVDKIRTALEGHKTDESSHAVADNLDLGFPILPTNLLKEKNELVCGFNIIPTPVIYETVKISSGFHHPVQEIRIYIRVFNSHCSGPS